MVFIALRTCEPSSENMGPFDNHNHTVWQPIARLTSECTLFLLLNFRVYFEYTKLANLYFSGKLFPPFQRKQGLEDLKICEKIAFIFAFVSSS